MAETSVGALEAIDAALDWLSRAAGSTAGREDMAGAVTTGADTAEAETAAAASVDGRAGPSSFLPRPGKRESSELRVAFTGAASILRTRASADAVGRKLEPRARDSEAASGAAAPAGRSDVGALSAATGATAGFSAPLSNVGFSATSRDAGAAGAADAAAGRSSECLPP